MQKYRLSDPIVLRGHRGCVNTALFSSDGSRIITGSDDTTVRYYSSESGANVATLKTAHTLNIFYAQEIPFHFGTKLLTCAADGRVLLSDAHAETCVSSYRQLYRHRGRAHRIALLPECADTFVSCGEDGVCCVYDLRVNPAAPMLKTIFYNNSGSVGSIYSVCTAYSNVCCDYDDAHDDDDDD